MKKLIIDVDYTISKKVDTYANALPNINMINHIKHYKENGFVIVLFSARNMNSFNGNMELINNITRPELLEWLTKNEIPFDELILGKPWNDEGFYIDDNAVRPLEFLNNSYDEIVEKLNKERDELWK